MDEFVHRMKCLGEHHARNNHEWEGGNCGFHLLKYCSCSKCSGHEIKCSGKLYKTKSPLKCSFHSMAYQTECERRASQGGVLVHPTLGSGHTDLVESAHSVFTKFGAKDQNLQRLHCNVSTNLALMQSNMTWLFKKRGPQYHWLLDLFERMGLPIQTGMAEALKLSNCKRAKQLKCKQTEKAEKKKNPSKFKHRGEEQDQRKAWGKWQKILQHSMVQKMMMVVCVHPPEPEKVNQERLFLTLVIKQVVLVGDLVCVVHWVTPEPVIRTAL